MKWACAVDESAQNLEDIRSQTCKYKKGSDWLKRLVEAQHHIFKL